MSEFGAYFDSIIAHCQCLTDMKLRFLPVSLLPTTVASIKKKLDSLILGNFELNLNTFLQIYQQISYIKEFKLIHEYEGLFQSLRKIHMSYTTFETFNIDIYEITKSYIVKICSTFKITFLNDNSKSVTERLPEDHQLCETSTSLIQWWRPWVFIVWIFQNFKCI